MARSVLGLDIGGANLKAAHSGGGAWLEPFELWKEPGSLADRLHCFLGRAPAFDRLAVTMTAELCDCFESKREGVGAVLDAVASLPVAPEAVRVWRNDGRLVDLAAARASPLQVAAANWLALATYAGRFAPKGPAILLDIGSTTTDLVPLHDGRPVPRGRTDPERIRCQELVYSGVRRTPVCALGDGVAAELFATTLDVYLVLGQVPENPEYRKTADGRPATLAAAHARLARMLCADSETSTEEQRLKLATKASKRQVYALGAALGAVAKRLLGPPETVIVSGSGEFLAPAVLDTQPACAAAKRVSLAEEVGPEASRAACAYALAVLASERDDGSG